MSKSLFLKKQQFDEELKFHIEQKKDFLLWRTHSSPTCFYAGGVYRKLQRVDDDFLAECAELKVNASNYGSPFWDFFKYRRPKPCAFNWYAGNSIGGIQFCEEGEYPGDYEEYDIRSAYLWSGLQGIPDFFSSCGFTKTIKRGGIYRLRLFEPSQFIPFIGKSDVYATTEEIEMSGIKDFQILNGFVFSSMSDCIEETFARMQKYFSPDAIKKIGRAYWGRWALGDGACIVSKVRSGKEVSASEIGRWFQNKVISHFIVSRVRLRVLFFAGLAIHAFVDSIIPRRGIRVPVGDSIGDWRVKNYFSDIRIAGCGRIQSRGRWEKHSGKKIPLLVEHKNDTLG